MATDQTVTREPVEELAEDEHLDDLDALDDIDDIEFALEEIENKIAPLALA